MNAVYLYICWTSIYTFKVRGSDTELKMSSSVRQRAPVGVIELWRQSFSNTQHCFNQFPLINGDYGRLILYIYAIVSRLRWRVLPLKQQNLNCSVFTLSGFLLPLKSLVKRLCRVSLRPPEGHVTDMERVETCY